MSFIMQRQRQRKKKVMFACGRRRRRRKRKKERTRRKIQLSQARLKELESNQVQQISGSNLEDKVVLFQYSHKVLFQKMERIAVGGTYESQDPSERKLQRSMTVRSAGDVSGYGSSRFLETKVQDRKDEDASVYETITGHNIQRMVEALSVWWYMNCFEEAMTPGGFSGGAVLLVQTNFSSLLSEGKENQVECVQENVKCSDIKAESEREKQFLGGAIFSKESLKNTYEIEQVWSLSVKNTRGRVSEPRRVFGSAVRRFTMQDLMMRDMVKGGSSSGFKVELARQKAGAFDVNQMGLQRNQVAGSGAGWCSSQCVHQVVVRKISVTDGWSSQVSGFIETAKRESMKKLSLTQSCVKAVYQLKKTVLRNEKVINITAMACEFHVWFIDGD
ncbi:hypothetical protein YC2023_069768 [Brassica napus]